MSAYRMVETRLLQPVSQAATGAPAQGEWVNAGPMPILDAWGALRPLGAELSASLLGRVGRQAYRWRGQLPDEVEPEPGWQLEIAGRRYRVIASMRSCGRTWRLDLERI